MLDGQRATRVRMNHCMAVGTLYGKLAVIGDLGNPQRKLETVMHVKRTKADAVEYVREVDTTRLAHTSGAAEVPYSEAFGYDFASEQ